MGQFMCSNFLMSTILMFHANFTRMASIRRKPESQKSEQVFGEQTSLVWLEAKDTQKFSYK